MLIIKAEKRWKKHIDKICPIEGRAPRLGRQAVEGPSVLEVSIMNALTEWLEVFFEEVSPREFYRDIFPSGELEAKGEYIKGKYTGIVVAITDGLKADGRRKVYRYSLTDGLEAVELATSSNDFCLCSPLSYAGKARTAENARMLYAIAVDVDKVRVEDGRPVGLESLWTRHIETVGRIPKPTYIVSSGTGLHLYYVLSQPLPLFYNIARELQDYKRALTRLIWHETIVNIRSVREIQQEGIYQGFRMPGTITKSGGRARAFYTGEKVSMEYLNSFVPAVYRAKNAEKLRPCQSLRLQEVAEKYPEWYERRIVKGEKRNAWAVNRNLYEWWKRQILEGATVGHRYYCLMVLAIYAQKCSHYDEKHNPNPVSRDELEKDCLMLLDYMEGLTVSEENHFGLDDVLAALEAFDERWTTFPRAAIEYKTAISIPANKRNYQKQSDHLEEARAIRDLRAKRRGEAWDAHNGRKSKAEVVQKWRKENPEGRKVDCIRATGLDKKTVYKHWEAEEKF